MDYFSESPLIEKISQKIIQTKQSAYSQQPFFYALNYHDNYEFVDAMVYNRYKQRLKTSLFFQRTTKHQNCIVYMHGYGSNRIQVLPILRYLPQGISLCCFDFSGEGKSEGNIITFGQKQKDDIKAVLGYLRICGYKKIILWGRSMGATCTLLFCQKYKPSDVVLQILDSPFISFREVALQLTKKRINVPDLILKLGLQVVHKNLQNKQYNPFVIDLNHPIQTDIPTVFIYSEKDQVISPQNSKKIISQFKGHYQRIVINQFHNSLRKPQTIKDILNIIKKYLFKQKQTIVKKENQKLPIQNQKIIKHRKKSISKEGSLKYDSYGIHVFSKHIQDQNAINKDREKTSSKGSVAQRQRRPKSSIKVYSKLGQSLDNAYLLTQDSPIRSQRPQSVKPNSQRRKILSINFIQ